MTFKQFLRKLPQGIGMRLLMLAALAATCPRAQAGVRFVKAGATGSADGTSWTNAFTSLQSGLAAAVAGDEIWVAAGTYAPSSGSDRTISFVMKSGVGIYGGFAGTETLRSQRNSSAHPTVLSGVISVTIFSIVHANHVVKGADGATLDGFTISGGSTAGSSGTINGGGMYNDSASPTVANCIFTGNDANATPTTGNGGAMYNRHCSPTVTGCTFDSNSAHFGGAMYNEADASPNVTGCTFSNNSAFTGGGMYAGEASNCIFSQNKASGNAGVSLGGGMYGCDAFNCTFTNNSSDEEGGGQFGGTATDCTFTGNSAALGGGGIFGGTALRCTFTLNSGSGIENFGNESAIDCVFANNTQGGVNGGYAIRCTFTRNGGYGMANGIASDCTFTENTGSGFSGINAIRCTATGNTGTGFSGGTINFCMATNNGGAGFSNGTINFCTSMNNRGGGISLTISGSSANFCIIANNSNGGNGGGVSVGSTGNAGYIVPSANSCIIVNNTAGLNGGGVFDGNAVNCVVWNNKANGSGGGMAEGNATNCTFTSNTAKVSGGGLFYKAPFFQSPSNSRSITNCIVAGNSAPADPEVHDENDYLVIYSSDVLGSGGSGALWNIYSISDGGGNIDADPQFADPSKPAGLDGAWKTRDDGLRLLATSPCVDAGSAAAAPATDILGTHRIGAPDMGAYEYYLLSAARDWALYR